MEHRIKIQQMDVEFENSVDAFKIRDSLSEVCRNRLLGAMEKLFDKKYRGGPLISISSLFIDTGQLKEDDWEGALVTSVIQQLEAALDKEAEHDIATCRVRVCK